MYSIGKFKVKVFDLAKIVSILEPVNFMSHLFHIFQPLLKESK